MPPPPSKRFGSVPGTSSSKLRPRSHTSATVAEAAADPVAIPTLLEKSTAALRTSEGSATLGEDALRADPGDAFNRPLECAAGRGGCLFGNDPDFSTIPSAQRISYESSCALPQTCCTYMRDEHSSSNSERAQFRTAANNGVHSFPMESSMRTSTPRDNYNDDNIGTGDTRDTRSSIRIADKEGLSSALHDEHSRSMFTNKARSMAETSNIPSLFASRIPSLSGTPVSSRKTSASSASRCLRQCTPPSFSAARASTPAVPPCRVSTAPPSPPLPPIKTPLAVCTPPKAGIANSPAMPPVCYGAASAASHSRSDLRPPVPRPLCGKAMTPATALCNGNSAGANVMYDAADARNALPAAAAVAAAPAAAASAVGAQGTEIGARAADIGRAARAPVVQEIAAESELAVAAAAAAAAAAASEAAAGSSPAEQEAAAVRAAVAVEATSLLKTCGHHNEPATSATISSKQRTTPGHLREIQKEKTDEKEATRGNKEQDITQMSRDPYCATDVAGVESRCTSEISLLGSPRSASTALQMIKEESDAGNMIPGNRRAVERPTAFLYRGSAAHVATSTAGMYGEMVESSVKQVLLYMRHYGADEFSVFCDLGSGRGAPCAIAAYQQPWLACLGIEKCSQAYWLSLDTHQTILRREMQQQHCDYTSPLPPSVLCCCPCLASHNVSESSSTPRLRTQCSICNRRGHPKGLLSAAAMLVGKEDLSTGAMAYSHVEYAQQQSCCLSSMSESNRISKEAERQSNILPPLQQQGQEQSQQSLRPEYPKQQQQQIRGEQQETEDEKGFISAVFAREGKALTPSDAPPRRRISFCQEDLSCFYYLDGVTHVYSFDAAMEGPLINYIVQLFMRTRTWYVYASFRSDLITRFDLRGAQLVAQVSSSMWISQEGRTTYIYVKNNWRACKAHHRRWLKRVLLRHYNGEGFRSRLVSSSNTTASAHILPSQSQCTAAINNEQQQEHQLYQGRLFNNNISEQQPCQRPVGETSEKQFHQGAAANNSTQQLLQKKSLNRKTSEEERCIQGRSVDNTREQQVRQRIAAKNTNNEQQLRQERVLRKDSKQHLSQGREARNSEPQLRCGGEDGGSDGAAGKEKTSNFCMAASNSSAMKNEDIGSARGRGRRRPERTASLGRSVGTNRAQAGAIGAVDVKREKDAGVDGSVTDTASRAPHTETHTQGTGREKTLAEEDIEQQRSLVSLIQFGGERELHVKKLQLQAQLLFQLLLQQQQGLWDAADGEIIDSNSSTLLPMDVEAVASSSSSSTPVLRSSRKEKNNNTSCEREESSNSSYHCERGEEDCTLGSPFRTPPPPGAGSHRARSRRRSSNGSRSRRRGSSFSMQQRLLQIQQLHLEASLWCWKASRLPTCLQLEDRQMCPTANEDEEEEELLQEWQCGQHQQHHVQQQRQENTQQQQYTAKQQQQDGIRQQQQQDERLSQYRQHTRQGYQKEGHQRYISNLNAARDKEEKKEEVTGKNRDETKISHGTEQQHSASEKQRYLRKKEEEELRHLVKHFRSCYFRLSKWLQPLTVLDLLLLSFLPAEGQEWWLLRQREQLGGAAGTGVLTRMRRRPQQLRGFCEEERQAEEASRDRLLEGAALTADGDKKAHQYWNDMLLQHLTKSRSDSYSLIPYSLLPDTALPPALRQEAEEAAAAGAAALQHLLQHAVPSTFSSPQFLASRHSTDSPLRTPAKNNRSPSPPRLLDETAAAARTTQSLIALQQDYPPTAHNSGQRSQQQSVQVYSSRGNREIEKAVCAAMNTSSRGTVATSAATETVAAGESHIPACPTIAGDETGISFMTSAVRATQIRPAAAPLTPASASLAAATGRVRTVTPQRRGGPSYRNSKESSRAGVLRSSPVAEAPLLNAKAEDTDKSSETQVEIINSSMLVTYKLRTPSHSPYKQRQHMLRQGTAEEHNVSHIPHYSAAVAPVGSHIQNITASKSPSLLRNNTYTRRASVSSHRSLCEKSSSTATATVGTPSTTTTLIPSGPRASRATTARTSVTADIADLETSLTIPDPQNVGRRWLPAAAGQTPPLWKRRGRHQEMELQEQQQEKGLTPNTQKTFSQIQQALGEITIAGSATRRRRRRVGESAARQSSTTDV